MANKLGVGCCCNQCVIHDVDFSLEGGTFGVAPYDGWDVRTGDWTVDLPTRKVIADNDTTAMAIDTSQHLNDTDAHWRVATKVYSLNTGEKGAVVFDYEDDDNFHMAAVSHTPGASTTVLTLEIIEMLAGVETVLETFEIVEMTGIIDITAGIELEIVTSPDQRIWARAVAWDQFGVQNGVQGDTEVNAFFHPDPSQAGLRAEINALSNVQFDYYRSYYAPRDSYAISQGWDCSLSPFCSIVSDTFDTGSEPDPDKWTEEAGDWGVSGGNVETSDSDAILISNVAGDYSPNDLKIRGKMAGTSDGDETRIIINWQTEQKFRYVKLEWTSSDVTMKLFKVDDGIETELENDTETGITAGDAIDFEVCFYYERRHGANRIMFEATIYKATGCKMSLTNIDGASKFGGGLYAGVGTGTISGTIEFDEIHIDRHKEDILTSGECEECETFEECTHCECDNMSRFYQVVITGFDESGNCSPSSNCAYFNGTWILDSQHPTSGVCDARHTESNLDLCGGENNHIAIIFNFGAAPESRVTVSLQREHAPSNPWERYTFDATYVENSPTLKCLELVAKDHPTAGTNHDPDIPVPVSTACDASGVTITVTAL